MSQFEYFSAEQAGVELAERELNSFGPTLANGYPFANGD
jgi:hypothetical protein